ncbi:MAG: response regulator [Spirochaetales bacterium]|nr:response regulator [Spirochaetales bacterium]
MDNTDFYDFIEEPEGPPPGPGTKKILVIDDITYVVKSISRILRSHGYFVVTAMTGKEAIEKFEKYRPNLITVDQKLPDMSGLQLVRKIKEIHGSEKIKVVFISAVQEKAEIKSILNSGIDNYLLKPFKKEMLIYTIKKLIG